MKKILFLLFLGTILLICGLSFHVIRYPGGVDIILKDHLTFRDTWVDVRKWTLFDYVDHSKRIRDYMLYEKHEDSLVKMVNEKKKELTQKADKMISTTKEKLKPVEKSIHEWISERLEK